MDEVFAVCDLYQAELKEAVWGLKRHGLNSNLLSCRTAHSFRERYRDDISSRSYRRRAKSSTVNREVIGVFAWAAVMMAFSGLGSWFGSHGIDSLVAIAAGKEGVTLMTYAILPMITMSTLLKYERSYFGYFADVTIRFMMLTSAIAQGVLIGSVLDTKHIQNEPLAFVTPITFAFIYAIVVESVGGQNSPVQIACAGSALFANYVVGLLTGRLSSTYELMALAYVAVNVAIMQLMLKAGSGSGHICQYVLLESVVFVHALFHLTSAY